MRPGYFLRRALRNMRHSPVLSLASVATVSLALTLLVFFAIAVLNVQDLLVSWDQEAAVVIYLEQEPALEQRAALVAEIEAMPEVSMVTYISAQTALERFRERLGADADLLDGLAPEVLPASLEIRLAATSGHPASFETLLGKLTQDRRFADVRHGREWREKFEAFLLLLRAIGAGLGGFLVFAAMVIVANTIKLTLYARQDELETMTMVGATSLFIKLPYLVEGAVQGFLGGCVALVFSFLAFQIVLRKSLDNLLLLTGVDRVHYLPLTWQVGVVVAGTLIGLLGSLFALRRFVRFAPA